MNSTFIQPGLQEVLRRAGDDEEVAASISFVDEKAAKRFASMANQVVFDTTLNIDYGEENITGKMRDYLSPKIHELNIQAVGNHVDTSLPGGLLKAMDRKGDDLGISSITSSESETNIESWGEDWVVSSTDI